MTWSKLDDQFHGHPKVAEAWERCALSIGLYPLALSYCGAYLTDGAVPERFVKLWLPDEQERERTTAALTSAGLWTPNGNGWQFHDYTDRNPSRQEVEKRRRRLAAAGRRGGRAKAANRRKKGPSHRPSQG